MSRDTADRQRAFVGLLRHPVVTRHSQPELWPLVYRHRSVLTDWFGDRLGYRLTVSDSAARLLRLPSGGRVTMPSRMAPPSRRVLVLAILAAAAAEDADDLTSTQDLSDRVRALSRHEDIELAPYDPDRFGERQLFVKAVSVLVSVGALRPTTPTAADQGDGWAQHRDSVGGAYEVRRELLLRMVDPVCLAAALEGSSAAGPEPTARFGLMRRLLELPVCLYADLAEAERIYLTSQRHRILAWCVEMTGWVVEQRAEGIALVAADEADTDLPFPKLRAADFTTLLMLDELIRDPGLEVPFGPDQLTRVAAEVAARHPKALTNELRLPGAMESTALAVLSALDLVRRVDGGAGDSYWLTPVAARFRNPVVVAAAVRLDEGAADD